MGLMETAAAKGPDEREVSSAEITASRLNRLARMDNAPRTRREKCGNLPVGWSRPKMLKKCPLIAAAYGIRL